jgi:streptogramin lyase
VAANVATSGLRRRLVEARALARLAARREPALDVLPADNAEFWLAVRALPSRQAQATDRSATRLDAIAGLDELLRRRRRQPPRRAAAAAAAALLVAAAAIWAGLALRPMPQPALGPITRFRAGPGPVSVALSPGAAWVLNSGDDTISRVDPSTGRTAGPSTDRYHGGLGLLIYATFAEGRLWVVHSPAGDSGYGISAIDPSTGWATNTLGVGDEFFAGSGIDGDLAVGGGAVWVALPAGDEVKWFDTVTGKLLGRIPFPRPTALALDDRTLWVATADGRLHRVDIDTRASTVTAAATTTETVTRIRVGQGGVWLMTLDGKLLRLDRRTGRIMAQVPGAFRAADLAVGAEGVWVYDQHQGAVLRTDPDTNRVARTIPVISQPLVELSSHVLALGAGAVWVVDKAGEAVVRVDPNR